MMPGAKKSKARSTTRVTSSLSTPGGDFGSSLRPVAGRPTNRSAIAHCVTPADKRRRSFMEQFTIAGEAPPLISDGIIPIHIDVTVNGHRILDNFLWNLDECSIKPQMFAKALDLNLLLSSAATVKSRIR